MTNLRCLIMLLALTPVAACAQTEPAPEKVLFVGNSFTYYNNSLHNHYRALRRAAHPEDQATGIARSMTISGGQLPEHRSGLPSMLQSDDWDVVVLQGHSRGPIEKATAIPFRIAAREYAKLIRARGAKPVFFMTWAYEENSEMLPLLADAYTSIGAELDATVVPVGLAFAAAKRERPEVGLRIADGRHPSLAGTYLAACTFFAVLHMRSPEGLAYDAGLDTEIAKFLQQVAWQTAQDYSLRSAH